MDEGKTRHEFLAAGHGFGGVVGCAGEGEGSDVGVYWEGFLDVAGAHLAGCLLVGCVAVPEVL